jgi:hypothetical protein
MSKKEAIETPVKYGCEFCKREFLRESTVMKHICEYKHRWLERDKHGSRMGFQAFLQFYAKHTASKKKKTQEEFIKSSYYTAFIKFGNYCVDAKVINPSRYVDWLLKKNLVNGYDDEGSSCWVVPDGKGNTYTTLEIYNIYITGEWEEEDDYENENED